MRITPSVAIDLLRTYTKTTAMKPEKINKYKDLMKEGKWIENRGLPLKLLDGELLDGRHRLTAIIRSGVTLSLPVWKISS